jgi:hypothetical protein
MPTRTAEQANGTVDRLFAAAGREPLSGASGYCECADRPAGARLDALREKRHAAAELAPFLHQKLTAVELKAPGIPGGEPVLLRSWEDDEEVVERPGADVIDVTPEKPPSVGEPAVWGLRKSDLSAADARFRQGWNIGSSDPAECGRVTLSIKGSPIVPEVVVVRLRLDFSLVAVARTAGCARQSGAPTEARLTQR